MRRKSSANMRAKWMGRQSRQKTPIGIDVVKPINLYRFSTTVQHQYAVDLCIVVLQVYNIIIVILDYNSWIVDVFFLLLSVKHRTSKQQDLCSAEFNTFSCYIYTSLANSHYHIRTWRITFITIAFLINQLEENR